jgi:hypothetical protein
MASRANTISSWGTSRTLAISSAVGSLLVLFEPIYNDGGDPIYVMDQISDERNKDTQWIEELALKRANTISSWGTSRTLAISSAVGSLLVSLINRSLT